MKASRTALISVLAAVALSGQLHGGLQSDGRTAVLTDRPRCRFAWLGWDYTNISNPLLFTKNTLDRSMIGIMRIPVGDTLPRGKTKIARGMTTQQITSLLRENLQGRVEKTESIVFDRATIAETEAVRVRYVERTAPTKQGTEYGFIRDGFFFHILFIAVAGREYVSEQKDFERLASTFRVLE